MYLSLPRLHFSGTFLATPSTVNNEVLNFGPRPVNDGNSGFNPQGNGKWDIPQASVTAVHYIDGTSTISSSDDSLVGAIVKGTNRPTYAKIVDLDPEQQLVSEIWGFQLQVGDPGNGVGSLVGAFHTAAFSDLWKRAQTGSRDVPLGAFWQSVLEQIQWAQPASSRFLRELNSISPQLLSIKFNVDGINLSPGANFGQGRVVGTIGPAAAEEPKHFVPARLLRTQPPPGKSQDPLFYFAPFLVDESRRKIIVDLGNSLPTATPGGAFDVGSIGNLEVATFDSSGSARLIARIDYTASNWYTSTAGVQELPADRGLTDAELTGAKSNPLAIVQVDAQGNVIGAALSENPDGTYLRADQFVFRMNPGETATVDLYATRFGQPAAGANVLLSYAPDRLPSQQVTVGVPQAALAFNVALPATNARGRVSFTLTARDPLGPRSIIDGQVYGVAYRLTGDTSPNSSQDPWDFVSVLVWNGYQALANPTWSDSVASIFAQYAKLYPVMKNFVDLGDYQSVIQNQAAIVRAMGFPVEHPGYMPVTRDLSNSKRNMILRWFALGAPM